MSTDSKLSQTNDNIQLLAAHTDNVLEDDDHLQPSNTTDTTSNTTINKTKPTIHHEHKHSITLTAIFGCL